jgi:hypothetical protein
MPAASSPERAMCDKCGELDKPHSIPTKSSKAADLWELYLNRELMAHYLVV